MKKTALWAVFFYGRSLYPMRRRGFAAVRAYRTAATASGGMGQV